MPLIPYPDVPMLAGVPPLNRQAGQTIPTPQIQPATVTNNAQGVSWGIVDSSGNDVLTPDSFIEFEYKEEYKIPVYPIEQGGFSSYNKVAIPFDLRLTVTCGGQGASTREDFLLSVESLLSSTTLVSVITPNDTYDNCNLIHFDYRREAKQGLSLLIVQLWFQEVRIAQASVPTTAQPSGATPSNNGQVNPVNVPSTSPATNAVPQ